MPLERVPISFHSNTNFERVATLRIFFFFYPLVPCLLCIIIWMHNQITNCISNSCCWLLLRHSLLSACGCACTHTKCEYLFIYLAFVCVSSAVKERKDRKRIWMWKWYSSFSSYFYFDSICSLRIEHFVCYSSSGIYDPHDSPKNFCECQSTVSNI